MDEFIGIIKLFAGTFAPHGWMYCNGAILNISSNTALFSILGPTYGGDGITTFALPDLRGRVPIGAYEIGGPGLKPIQMGQTLGTETVTLTTDNMPAHSHQGVLESLQLPVNSSAGDADTSSPSKGFLANTGADSYASASNDNHVYSGNLGALKIGAAGGNTAFDIHQPSLGLNYIICVYGVYPSRG